MESGTIGFKRWVAKKAARIAVAGVSLPATVWPPHRNRLRVLTYHRFVEERRSPFSVGAAALERQMDWLGKSGLAVGSQAVSDVLSGSGACKAGVLVTMDDGDPSVIDTAASIFERHRIPYVVYVVPGRIGHGNHMSAAQLRELAARGAEIGSHTMTHRSLPSLSGKDMAAELIGSKGRIEDIIGQRVNSFAYPFGTGRDFDARAAEALRRAGYLTAFTSQHGAVEAGMDAMMLPRIKIEGGDPDWLFRAACHGAMDQWKLIDAGLVGLQRPDGKDLMPPLAA